MNPALLHLIDMQRIDVKIDALGKQRATTSQKLNDLRKRRDEIKGQVGGFDAQISEKEKERRGLDTNLQLDSAKTKKWEARLNEIRNQREFLALSREVETQKKQNTEAQEKAGALASEVRDLSAKAETLRDDLAELEVDIETEEAQVEAKLKEMDAEVQAFEKERAEFSSQVPPSLLKRYEQIRQRRGAALGPCGDGRCLACNMGLPPQLYNTVIRGETIEACPSCNRILYYREPTTEQPQA